MLANFNQTRQFNSFYPNDLRPGDALAVVHHALLLSTTKTYFQAKKASSPRNMYASSYVIHSNLRREARFRLSPDDCQLPVLKTAHT